MDKIVEVYSYNFMFNLPIEEKDDSFSIKNFNYGNGSLFEKFKEKVPVSLHNGLKSFEEIDIYIKETNITGMFNFSLMVQEFHTAMELAQTIIQVCKHVHNILELKTEVSFTRSALIETTFSSYL